MFKNHLWVSTCHNCFLVCITSLKIVVFLAPYILFYKFQDVIFCSVVFHCVNVSHFPYLFFNCRVFRLCPGSGYDKKAAINIVEHMPLCHDWASSSFEYILESSFTGFWGRLLHNFLNNQQINIKRGSTTSSMNFLWDLSTFGLENGKSFGFKH